MTKYVSYNDRNDDEIVIVRPTLYEGVNFRSRLEARWAAYFDVMGAVWIYEPEMIQTPHGAYVPDFYFPELHTYAEIKPRKIPIDPRWVHVSKSKEAILLMLFGTPREMHTDYNCALFIEKDGNHDPVFSRGVPFSQRKYGRGDGIYRQPESNTVDWARPAIEESENHRNFQDATRPIPRTPSITMSPGGEELLRKRRYEASLTLWEQGTLKRIRGIKKSVSVKHLVTGITELIDHINSESNELDRIKMLAIAQAMKLWLVEKGETVHPLHDEFLTKNRLMYKTEAK